MITSMNTTSSKTTVYRVQPIGKDLNHRSETSEGNADRGPHVFGSIDELKSGIRGWCKQSFKPEILAIECDRKDLRDNGDYEGFVLLHGCGEIVARTPFGSWSKLAAWCRE